MQTLKKMICFPDSSHTVMQKWHFFKKPNTWYLFHCIYLLIRIITILSVSRQNDYITHLQENT